MITIVIFKACLLKGILYMDSKKLMIRSSTAEFLIFEKQNHSDGVEVRYEDGTLWMTQKMMAALFDVEVNTITYHLK